MMERDAKVYENELTYTRFDKMSERYADIIAIFGTDKLRRIPPENPRIYLP